MLKKMFNNEREGGREGGREGERERERERERTITIRHVLLASMHGVILTFMYHDVDAHVPYYM